jgi:hypothetical protein
MLLLNIGRKLLQLTPVKTTLLVAIISLGLIDCATTYEKQTAESSNKADLTAIEEKFGVKVVAIRVTASGHMLDFRYQVIDEQKAAEVFKRQTKPYLIHQASGKTSSVPTMAKVGPLRSSNKPQKGRIYWMFFSNPEGFVAEGDKVTVVIGNFKVENLSVQ